MSYVNIVFVKLFLNLFDEDDRFLYQLNESQQLLYIKLLYLAGRTQNKIPANGQYLRNRVNYGHNDGCFLADIQRIMAIFPKFAKEGNFYYFKNFKQLHNFISKGTTKEFPCVSPDKEEDKEEDKDKELLRSFTSLWKAYPRRDGKKGAFVSYKRSLKGGSAHSEIEKAIRNYMDYVKDNKTEPQFIKKGSTFFNNWEDWVEYEPTVESKTNADYGAIRD